jgi:hypothetical protein
VASGRCEIGEGWVVYEPLTTNSTPIWYGPLDFMAQDMTISDRHLGDGYQPQPKKALLDSSQLHVLIHPKKASSVKDLGW